MKEAWIRKPRNWLQKISWHKFAGRDGKWWIDKRFYLKDGLIDEKEQEEFIKCKKNKNLIDVGVQHSFKARHQCGIIRCSCGRQVWLISTWANPCQCGTEYGEDGHSLTPRNMWRNG